MRRLCIFIAVLLSVMVTSSWAEWRPPTVPVNGAPKDVEIQDAGLFTLATDGGSSTGTTVGMYELFHALDGGTNVIASANAPSGQQFIAAWIDPTNNNCLTGLTNFANLICASPFSSRAILTSTPRLDIARHTVSGGMYVSGKLSGSATGVHFATWDAGSPEFFSPSGIANIVATNATRVGTTDYGLFGNDNGTAFLAIDGGRADPGPDFATGISPIREVQPFIVGAQVRGLIAGGNGMVLANFDGGVNLGISGTQGLEGVDVTGVAFQYGTGGPEGDGFGMAIGTPSGGQTQVYSAVPDPSAPGVKWQVNTSMRQPATIKKVRCWNGQFCVLFGDVASSSGNNMLLYFNSFKPGISPVGFANVNEANPVPVNVMASVSDQDGDAVWESWVVDSPLQLTYPPDGGRDTVGIALPTASALLCGQDTVGFTATVTASDGLASHVNSAQIPIFVKHTVAPGAPVLPQLPTTTLRAGGPGLTVTVGAGSGLCPPTGFSWSQSGSANFTLTPNGDTARIDPPLNSCDPSASAQFSVIELDGPVVQSQPSTFTLALTPWGPPEAALASAGPVTQYAGTSEPYPATNAHVCADAGTGYPGVDNVWNLSSTANVSFLADGVPVSNLTGVKASVITVDAASCTSGTVTLDVTPYNRDDDGGMPGPRSSMTVDIVNVLTPLADGGISLDGGYDPGTATASGSISSSANCASLRDLRGRVELARADGSLVDSKEYPLAGSPASAAWDVKVPIGACTGESFVVTGQIVDQNGTGPSAQWPFTTPTLAAGIADVEVVKAPEAVCGEDGVVRAAGELKAIIGPLQCPVVQLTWEQLSGAPVTGAPLTGADVGFEATGGFEQLVSQPLLFKVTADAGGGNAASVEKSVPVTLGHLVSVRHRTDAPIASESGILGVAVSLENPGACGLTGVSYREQLDGLRYVEGSARLDGAPVDVVEEDGALVLSGVELPARGARALTYSARPRLLATPRPNGEAFLSGLPISDPEQGLGDLSKQGCGCSGGGAGLSSVALALAGLWLRRARRRA